MSHPLKHTTTCAALIGAVLLLASLTGCGDRAQAHGETLSKSDRAICLYAFRGDAMGVYQSTPAGDSGELIKIASAIVIGSTDEEDQATIERVVTFCRTHGYDQEFTHSTAG